MDVGIGEDDIVTFGCVILDDKAKTVLSLCKNDSIVCRPSLVEFLALRWSMETAKNLNPRKVIFQTDAKLTVDCVNQFVKDASLELVVDDCRHLMKSFMCSSTVFIPRHFNYVAHALAQLAKSTGSKTWMGICPLMVVSLLSFYSCC